MTDTWQSIETAPKDGTKIDLWMVDEKGAAWRVTDAYWVENRLDELRTPTPSGRWEFKKVARDGWFAPHYDYDADGFCDVPKTFDPNNNGWLFTTATHWMPLPKPPVQP